jgi:hypothetical protein
MVEEDRRGALAGWVPTWCLLSVLFCFVLFCFVLGKAEQIDMPRWEGGPGMYLSIW